MRAAEPDPVTRGGRDVWAARRDGGLQVVARTGRELPGSGAIEESISVITVRVSTASP